MCAQPRPSEIVNWEPGEGQDHWLCLIPEVWVGLHAGAPPQWRGTVSARPRSSACMLIGRGEDLGMMTWRTKCAAREWRRERGCNQTSTITHPYQKECAFSRACAINPSPTHKSNELHTHTHTHNAKWEMRSGWERCMLHSSRRQETHEFNC